MNRRLPRRAFPALVLLLVALLQSWRSCDQQRAPLEPREGTYHVQRVVDGDTLLLADHTRLRLLGIDTPETVKPDHPVEPWGPEATAFTRDFVAGGTVRLQFDIERLDQYGRLLAYLWVDDKLLNEELLRAGLARWEQNYHYSQQMKNRFRRAQREAQEAQRGIWSAPRPR